MPNRSRCGHAGESGEPVPVQRYLLFDGIDPPLFIGNGRLCLCDFEFRAEAALEAPYGNISDLLLLVERAVCNIEQLIVQRQLDIRAHDVRFQFELRGAFVGGCRVREIERLECAAAVLAPHIEVPGRRSVQSHARQRTPGTVAGCARPLIKSRGIVHQVYRRKERRASLLYQGSRLAKGGFGSRDRLVGDIYLPLQRVEGRVAVHRPPLAAIDVIARRRNLPTLQFLVGCRERSLRQMIIGAERACAERRAEQRDSERAERGCSRPVRRTHCARRLD